jgi:hypothetical protein
MPPVPGDDEPGVALRITGALHLAQRLLEDPLIQ